MEINDTLEKPEARLERMLSYNLTQMIYVVVKLGIPDLLKNGAKTAEELTALVGAHPRSLFRLMRALASQGVFIQDIQDSFSLTEISELLCKDARGTRAPFALSYGEPWWWGAWSDLLYSVQTGETAFDHINGTSLFEFLAHNPQASLIFNNNMTAMTTEEAQAVVNAYDFSSARLIVDVGGGQGALVNAILNVYPQPNAIIFDLPTVVASTEERLEAANISARCTVVGGSFFDSVPPGGDIYILKDILHDWNDASASFILGNVRRAVDDTAHLLLIERVILPENASVSAKMVDINMLVMSGGMERTVDEYRSLLVAAGFVLKRVIQTESGTSIVEAQPAITESVPL